MKPVVAQVYECSQCGRKSVAEAGAQMMCQSCVNEFLARNVGVMQPAEEKPETPENPVPIPEDRNR